MLAAMNPNPRMMERINPIELNGGQGAERLCERFDITRAELDEWALLSHHRAVAAHDAGRFADEIVPVEGLAPDGRTAMIDRDQGPRRDTSLEKIASCSRSIGPDGRITAAGSSGQPTAPRCA
jgi:acetyl-CoA acyltransferase